MSAPYDEIVSYLATVPGASPAWAEGLFSANLSLASIASFVTAMTMDCESPLRRNEEGLMGAEISRINRDRGIAAVGERNVSKLAVRLRVVLSPAEQTRVMRLVGPFCQPIFETQKKFSANGHAVMNAVRRAVTALLISKVPDGGSVIEVGPDVRNWMLSPTPGAWGTVPGQYTGARPNITPRDVVRAQWVDLARYVKDARLSFFSEDTVGKASVLLENYSSVFKNKKIQDIGERGEYILSFDANYDIKFSDMPVIMAGCGARAWYGSMVRAKGLTRATRLTGGKLDLMGATFKVDWPAGRIDFRHPGCSAFGYSHDVFEYMRYEEHNGFVWTTRDCHYVYSKGPETNAEILVFQVIRVPKLHRMYEPRFVENPHSGKVRLTSLWATGDEVDGVPRAFERVVFFVDALNFSKVLEKRRALDHRGDLASTVSIVRSTNVRFWLHGTPVSVTNKIEARLADATAVVVEALVCEQRLVDNRMFTAAMGQYSYNLASTGWLTRCLETVVDLRAVTGTISGPVMRVWEGIRTSVIDRALSSLGEVTVGAELVPSHVVVEAGADDKLDCEVNKGNESICKCGEIAEIRAAICVADGDARKSLSDYLDHCLARNACDLCGLRLDDLPEVQADDCSEVDSGYGSADTVKPGSASSDSDSSCSGDNPPVMSEVGSNWKDEDNEGRVEAKSMDEFLTLESYLIHAQLTEVRIDSMRIFSRGPVSDGILRDHSTTRTKHSVLQFMGSRCVKKFGHPDLEYGAIYNHVRDLIVPVRLEKGNYYANVPDGFYYTCNRLRVWNGPELIDAVEYARSYGGIKMRRADYKVTLGVPGAGKTYGLMAELSSRYVSGERDMLVLAVTKKSVAQAIDYGCARGIDKKWLESHIMTLDRYLMHCKFFSKYIYIDEFPMVHIGKIDAAISVSGAMHAHLLGDARQIPYDPFCAEFEMSYATLGDSVNEANVTFLPETHRLPSDVCAMWLDKYPSIYPCSCCRVDTRGEPSLSYQRVRDVEFLRFDGTTRFHTYKQDEKDDLKGIIGARGDAQDLRDMPVGGMATVHEDQGTTHSKVVTVRLHADYDKNASQRNPSLYNRVNYVLTDTTRHTLGYVYYTLSEEEDEVIRRIQLSKDPQRLQMVVDRQGLGFTKLKDML